MWQASGGQLAYAYPTYEGSGVKRDVPAAEQPLIADLFDLPSADDVGLLCTNLRMMDGKRPIFIDQIEATFFFPYHVIRFVEIPKGAAPAPSKSRRKGPAARKASSGTARTMSFFTARNPPPR